MKPKYSYFLAGMICGLLFAASAAPAANSLNRAYFSRVIEYLRYREAGDLTAAITNGVGRRADFLDGESNGLDVAIRAIAYGDFDE